MEAAAFHKLIFTAQRRKRRLAQAWGGDKRAPLPCAASPGRTRAGHAATLFFNRAHFPK